MDPNAALYSILSGHMISEHVESLREWLLNGGFHPNVIMPVDCHVAFFAWPKNTRVAANATALWAYSEYDQLIKMSWNDVLKLKDSEY